MNILITSPRAPVTWEWIQTACSGGHRVRLCDSLHYPVARFNRFATEYRRIPAPRLDFAGYRQAVLPLIDWADRVIPTCEDIFYLAQLQLSAEQRAKCWMPERRLLFALHHKAEMFSCLPDVPHVRHLETRLIETADDIVFDGAQRTVLKPVFSRFGRAVVRGVNEQSVRGLNISAAYPWVQQRFIEGEGLCNYAVCEHGKVVAHAAYRPDYLLNRAAATYFRPIDDARAEALVRAFAERHRYHGQVAFDFIDDGRDLWVLECNPRATSGLHLLSGTLAWDSDGLLRQTRAARLDKALTVGAALPLLFGLPALRHGRFRQLWHDYREADDAIGRIPAYAHALALGEMVWRKLLFGTALTSASTFDIEYDGADDERHG